MAAHPASAAAHLQWSRPKIWIERERRAAPRGEDPERALQLQLNTVVSAHNLDLLVIADCDGAPWRSGRSQSRHGARGLRRRDLQALSRAADARHLARLRHRRAGADAGAHVHRDRLRRGASRRPTRRGSRARSPASRASSRTGSSSTARHDAAGAQGVARRGGAPRRSPPCPRPCPLDPMGSSGGWVLPGTPPRRAASRRAPRARPARPRGCFQSR